MPEINDVHACWHHYWRADDASQKRFHFWVAQSSVAATATKAREGGEDRLACNWPAGHLSSGAISSESLKDLALVFLLLVRMELVAKLASRSFLATAVL